MDTNLSQRKLQFLAVILLISFSSISQGQSQSININDYATKYSVKIGDSMQYRYSRIIVSGFNYFNSSIFLPNGTDQIVKITQGTLLTITIKNVSITPTMNVQANETFLTPNGQTYHSERITGLFVLPSFDNQSIVNEYVNAINKQNNYNPNQGYSCDNTFLYLHSYGSYPTTPSNGLSVNITDSYNLAINWHTGWLENQDFSFKYSNGTILSSIRIDRVSNNQLDQILNTGMNLTLFILPISIIALVIFAFVSYKRNNKTNLTNSSNDSFSHYLATNFKKQKPNSRSKATQVDHSLEIIEDILKNSEN